MKSYEPQYNRFTQLLWLLVLIIGLLIVFSFVGDAFGEEHDYFGLIIRSRGIEGKWQGVAKISEGIIWPINRLFKFKFNAEFERINDEIICRIFCSSLLYKLDEPIHINNYISTDRWLIFDGMANVRGKDYHVFVIMERRGIEYVGTFTTLDGKYEGKIEMWRAR